jgi:cobyrinic acid a,c-diamide synthase
LRKDLKEAAESGLPIYAECGGLMFLGENIFWHGKKYPMVGVLPVDFEVCERPQGHGYVKARVTGSNPYYEKGTLILGHEFHYSRPINLKENAVSFAFSLEKGHGFGQKRDGVVYRNILGAYTHIHSLGQREWAMGLVKAALAWKKYRLGPLHYFRRELEEGARRELAACLDHSTFKILEN